MECLKCLAGHRSSLFPFCFSTSLHPWAAWQVLRYSSLVRNLPLFAVASHVKSEPFCLAFRALVLSLTSKFLPITVLLCVHHVLANSLFYYHATTSIWKSQHSIKILSFKSCLKYYCLHKAHNLEVASLSSKTSLHLEEITWFPGSGARKLRFFSLLSSCDIASFLHLSFPCKMRTVPPW